MATTTSWGATYRAQWVAAVTARLRLSGAASGDVQCRWVRRRSPVATPRGSGVEVRWRLRAGPGVLARRPGQRQGSRWRCRIGAARSGDGRIRSATTRSAQWPRAGVGLAALTGPVGRAAVSGWWPVPVCVRYPPGAPSAGAGSAVRGVLRPAAVSRRYGQHRHEQRTHSRCHSGRQPRPAVRSVRHRAGVAGGCPGPVPGAGRR